jgi:hypothetical protein
MASIPASSFTFLQEIALSNLKTSHSFFTPNTHNILDKIVKDTIYMLLNIIENKQKHKSNNCKGNFFCTILKLENVLEYFNNVNRLFKTNIQINEYMTNTYLFKVWMDYYKYYSESFINADNIINNIYYKPYNICIPVNYFKMITSATENIIKQKYKYNYQQFYQQIYQQNYQQIYQQYYDQYYQQYYYQQQIAIKQAQAQQEHLDKLKKAQQKKDTNIYANSNLDINDSSKMWNPFVHNIIKNVFDDDCDYECECEYNCDDNCECNKDNLNYECNKDNLNFDNGEAIEDEINQSLQIEDKAMEQITKRRYRKRGGRRVREQRERKQQWLQMQKQKEREVDKDWSIVKNHKKHFYNKSKKYYKKSE